MKKRSTLTACVIATLGTSIAIAPATVAMAAPAAPASTSSSSTAAFGNGFRITSSTDYERGTDLTITGTGARAHQDVSLWVDGNLELSVSADDEGDWEFTVLGRFTTVDSLTYQFRSGLENPITETFTAADGPVLGGVQAHLRDHLRARGRPGHRRPGRDPPPERHDVRERQPRARPTRGRRR